MPRLRLLADNALADGTSASGQDDQGNPVFDAGVGENVVINLDASGYAGADTISTSVWDSPDSVTISGATLAGKVASCRALVPDDSVARGLYYRVRNTLTLSTGATRKTTVWLRAMGR